MIIVLVAVIFVVLVPIFIYNRLVLTRNRVNNAWSQIDVQLKRRHDLIPNLVEVCKGYMKHERELLENVTKARTQAIQAGGGAKEKANAENMLSGTLKSLFAVSENYPQLRANENMQSLQEELSATENKISFARQHYNDEVMRYNVAIQKFPNSLLAGMFGFQQREFFEIENPEERKNVRVKF